MLRAEHGGMRDTCKSISTAVGVCLAVFALSGCITHPRLPDGRPAVAFIEEEVAVVARICASENFAPDPVRTQLLASGFVERQRPGIRQLERFPEGGGPLAQGVTVPSSEPCEPRVNAMFARESLDAAGKELIKAGFVPSTETSVLVRGEQRIRLTAYSPSIGGIAQISMKPQ